jgi:hypothetical protein
MKPVDVLAVAEGLDLPQAASVGVRERQQKHRDRDARPPPAASVSVSQPVVGPAQLDLHLDEGACRPRAASVGNRQE